MIPTVLPTNFQQGRANSLLVLGLKFPLKCRDEGRCVIEVAGSCGPKMGEGVEFHGLF